MYQSETLDAVRDAAQILTREGKVLTVGNPEFPLAVFADTYKVDAEPTNTELPDTEMVAVEEYFDEMNQESTSTEDDTRENIVSNLFTAVAKVQFNTSNIIVPAIKAMHEYFAGMQSVSSQADYQVKSWRYLAPHNDASLVNHINTRYVNVQGKESVRSFHLETQTAEAIIEMMAVNNPHMEQEQVTEWALQVGSERIEAVWNSLFSTGGVVVPAGLPYLSAQEAPFNVDDILTAYFICGHYIDNPVQVPGVSVDTDEWEHAMKVMHEQFGMYLSRAYMRRADARESGTIILRNEAVNPIVTRRAVVIANGDVLDPWVLGGGDIQAILGACVENTGVTDVRHLDANSIKFIERWHEVYPMVQQAAQDFADRQRINNVITTFREVGRSELLKGLYTPETESRLIDALRYIRRDDYDNPYKVFSNLICRVYFPESTYLEYLDEIDTYGQKYPRATGRELATQAIISLVAIFQAKQMVVERFMPEIDVDGGAGGPVDESGLLAISDPSVPEADEFAEPADGEEGGDLPADTDLVDDDVSLDTEVGDTEVIEDTELTEASDGDETVVDETVVDEPDDDFVDAEEGDDEPDPYADLETVDEGEEVEEEVEEVAEEEEESDGTPVDEAPAEEEESEEDDDTPLN